MEHPVMSFVDALTDAEGRYEMHDLPEGTWPLLQFGVIVNEDDALSPDLEFPEVFAGETAVVDFKPEGGSLVLRGVVTHHDGSPAASKSLWLMPASARGPESMRSTLTEADGTYSIALPPDEYMLFTSGPDPKEMTSLATLDLTAGVDFVHDVVLPGASISGQVADGVTGDPVPETALVLVGAGSSGANTDFRGKAFSDEQGRYTFPNLKPGLYQVICFSMGGYGQEISGVIDVGDNEKVGGIDLHLWAGGGLKLSVIDAAGKAVVHVPVQLRNARGEWVRFQETPQTDGAGRFGAPGMTPGTWTVLIDAPGFERYEEEFDVIAGEVLSATVELTRR
jgi:hypothetical protein